MYYAYVALQEVSRDWIFKFDAQYITRFEHRLTDNGLSCRSCGKDFEVNDIIHAQYRSRGAATKRDLVCAIFHKVITLKEAKQLAPNDLGIDWQQVKQDVDALMQKRRMVLMRGLFYFMATGLFTALTTFPLLL